MMGAGSKPTSFATSFPMLFHVAFLFIVSAGAFPHLGQPIRVFLDRAENGFTNPNATPATARSLRRRTFPGLSNSGSLPGKAGGLPLIFMQRDKVQLTIVLIS